MSSAQKIWTLVIFLLTLLIGLITQLPAKQIYRVVTPPPELSIQGLRGSITAGRIASIGYQGIEFSDIEYAIQYACLIKLSVCYKVVSSDKRLTLEVESNVITRDVILHDSEVQLGNEVVDMIPGLLVRPKGSFALRVERMTLENMKLADLQAQLEWMDAGIEGEQQSLGNYIADISREKDNLKVELGDSESLLSLSGGGNIGLDGQYDLDIQLGSRQGLNPSVKGALDMMAKKTGLDRYAIKRSGRLPANMVGLLRHIEPAG